jgi:hypothetical protein
MGWPEQCPGTAAFRHCRLSNHAMHHAMGSASCDGESFAWKITSVELWLSACKRVGGMARTHLQV